ncbi:TPA: hypothetical protein ACFRG8_001355 [Neisseria lactamica]|uniref:hypothetical protein n=1 Tax=Neisseria lactamica TaxID=486 RepID=UPI000376C29A|nr:hypothetical protein [Neisseria lactamica]
MAVLFTMLVLVIGYHYARNLPSEKVNLKRSAGWETYVYLGFHGLRFLILALFSLIILWVLAFIVLRAIDYIFDSSIQIYLQRQITRILFDDIQVYHVLIAAFSWALCQSEIQDKTRKGNTLIVENIKNYDGLLRLVIEAAAKQKPIRLSLKSRKIYVGLVMEEQFESGDLDYVLIVPLVSGYRDKDTLDIFFDCSYLSVYEKHELLSGDEELSEEKLLKLNDFRLAIKAGEIESVAFFEFSVLNEFERYKKSPEVLEK